MQKFKPDMWLKMLWFWLNNLKFYTFHSFDYENAGYQTADLIKMDILLNGKPVEELVIVVHR